MLTLTSIATFIALRLLALNAAPASLVEAIPVAQNDATPDSAQTNAAASSYWLANIQRQGSPAFGDSGYKVYRNVQEYGAKGGLPFQLLPHSSMLILAQETALPTTLPPSTVPSLTATAAARAAILAPRPQHSFTFHLVPMSSAHPLFSTTTPNSLVTP